MIDENTKVIYKHETEFQYLENISMGKLRTVRIPIYPKSGVTTMFERLPETIELYYTEWEKRYLFDGEPVWVKK